MNFGVAHACSPLFLACFVPASMVGSCHLVGGRRPRSLSGNHRQLCEQGRDDLLHGVSGFQGIDVGRDAVARPSLSRPPLARVAPWFAANIESARRSTVLMIIGAMVSGTIVYSLSVPTWLRLVVYVLDVPVAICGFLFTFRDLG